MHKDFLTRWFSDWAGICRAQDIWKEVAEGQISGAMQRAARGIYDENAKLFSLSDENAVFNPKAMSESALMDALPPALMGGFDRRRGTPEPARVKVDAELGNNVRPDKGKNTGNMTKAKKQDMETELFIQNLRNGDISKIKDAPAHVLRNPKVQKIVREETGVNISPLDNPKRKDMMQKYKLASIEMKRKKAKEEGNGPVSKSSLEKPAGKTYNKNNKKK